MKGLYSLLLVVGMPALAQDAPRDHGLLVGVAVDSLRGGLLRGALLSVEGTSRIGVTDSLGRFRIDSIPPGAYAIELFHELLDTLGVRVRTPAVRVAADSAVAVMLGIPSVRTIVQAKCGASADSGAALLGMVIAADSERPLSDALVSLWWLQIEVGREIGVRREPRSRVTTTDAAGRYCLCGLPSDLSAEISATRGRDSTSVISLSISGMQLATAMLFLPGADSDGPGPVAAAVANSATVRGVVVDSAGKPVTGARVGLTTSAAVVTTDSTGAFTLTTDRGGTQALVVRRLGYQPVEMTVNLSRRAPREVTVRLATFVPVLDAVFVQARRDAVLERIGFAGRRRTGTGRFLTQEQLERRHAFRIADFLSLLPGLRRGITMRANCTVFWVDGMKMFGHPDEFMSPAEVGAIEAYTASMAPSEFKGLGGCAVVLIWTKWRLGLR